MYSYIYNQMSTDFQRILLKDDRIGCITDQIKYGVLKGGQNVTSQEFNAISKSTSAHVFNIAVPSLETIISREVLWTCDVTFKIVQDQAAKDAGFAHMFTVNYGVTDALAPFPLHQLVSTMTTTINNNSVSMNIQDVLPVMLRMSDPDELAEYDSTTPTTLDYLANYRHGVDIMEYQIQAHSEADAANRRPVVIFPGAPAAPAAGAYTGLGSQKFISYPSNVLSYDNNRPVCGGRYRTPRGSFVVKRIYNGAGNTPVVGDATVYVDVRITEPILISPFVFGSPENKAGFYGITNMNFQMNLAANANRAWRSVKFHGAGNNHMAKTATVERFDSSSLTFTFLTGHPTDQLPSRNIVPYYELPVYRTTGPATIAGRPLKVDATGAFPTPVSQQVRSNNIQLNMIPDKLILFCRRIIPDTSYADAYLTITGVNINFNNNAGILSNMTQAQLYKASVASGLSNMSWAEFSGLTVGASNVGTEQLTAEPASGFSGVGSYAPVVINANNPVTPGFQMVPTVGSIVVLNFAEVIQLTEDYYAPGSLGSFNLQVAVTVINNQNEDFLANQWELILIPMNSGIFVNERGTSSVYTGLLTKQDVLDASGEQEHYTHGTIKRMIGGGFLDNLKSGMKWIHSKLPAVREALGHIQGVHPYAKVGHDVLKTMGYGRSGGGHSGGSKLENRLM